ncbi:YncE family protein [Halovivax sp.]|uniref:YncE family protein n=1 Tax=Halovivax sp. TaxID=1935978 RepID=UPI0025B9C5D9|nr:hypothetical protein [Halovivax sp.]
MTDHVGVDDRRNADDGSTADGSRFRPRQDRRDPFADGVDRRRLLRSSAAAGGAAALAGCLGNGDESETAPTVYVFNTGDRTVTIVDAEANEAVETAHVDTTASFPANQYGTGADSGYDVCWLNVSGGVVALDQRDLEEIARVETGFGPNYPNLSPDEDHLLVAAGGTTGMDPEPDPDDPEDHPIVRVDADPESDEFGEITGAIETGYAGPCDVTMDADGEHAYVPEIAHETLRVVRTDPLETVAEVDVGEPAGDGDVLPFMATAAWDGDLLAVENGEGELGPDGDREGSESVWDVSDPEEPEEITRITRDDGLPAMPITSEIDPDGEVAYLFTPDADSVTVIDLDELAVAGELEVGGSAISAAWGPNREQLYVPVQTADHVAVIDHAEREVVETIETGDSPTGAVAGMIRPEPSASQRIAAALAGLGVEIGDSEPTACPEGNCYCG